MTQGRASFSRLRRQVRLRRLLRLYGAFLRDFLRALFQPRLEHYAASLSFSTLFSIVPLTAIMIAIFTALPALRDCARRWNSSCAPTCRWVIRH